MKLSKVLPALVIAVTLMTWSAKACIDLTSYGNQPFNNSAGCLSSWVASCVNNYNSANASCLSAPDNSATYVTVTSPAPANSGSNPNCVSISTGKYSCAVLCWNNGQSSQTYQCYYIGNTCDLSAGSVCFTNKFGCLNSYLLCGPTPHCHTAVPEPSTWVAGSLIALPMIGTFIRTLRRKETDQE
jgi:hypothetical protein